MDIWTFKTIYDSIKLLIKYLKGDFSLKKFLLGLVLFIVLFYGYAMIVAIISMIPLYFIEVNTNAGGGDSGIWAYGLIAAIVISPILSLITTSKIIKR